MSDINDLLARLTERQQQEFTLACARRVQHLMRDPRSVAVLEVRERWLRGEATDREMAKAREAADAAAVSAWAAPKVADEARAAARAAAWAAAWAAEADAARAAAAAREVASALAAALAAEAAGRAAAYDAERAWQRAELERMLKEGGGA